MAIIRKTKVEGLRDLELALRELPKATGKRVLRDALRDAGEPIEQAAAARAPVATGELRTSHTVSTKLSKRQRGIHRKWMRTTPVVTPAGWRSDVTKSVFVFVGPGPLPQAHLKEFGTATQPPEPFMRPAWDGQKENALAIFVDRIAERIEAARQRLARKAERLARAMKSGSGIK